MPSNHHPTAIINPKAEIGANVTIGPFAIVEADSAAAITGALEGLDAAEVSEPARVRLVGADLDEIKAAADYVTASNNQDGIALAVEKFVDIGE